MKPRRISHNVMMTVVVPGNEANAVHFLAHYFLRTCFMLVLLLLLPLLLADTNFCWGDRITFMVWYLCIHNPLRVAFPTSGYEIEGFKVRVAKHLIPSCCPLNKNIILSIHLDSIHISHPLSPGCTLAPVPAKSVIMGKGKWKIKFIVTVCEGWQMIYFSGMWRSFCLGSIFYGCVAGTPSYLICR